MNDTPEDTEMADHGSNSNEPVVNEASEKNGVSTDSNQQSQEPGSPSETPVAVLGPNGDHPQHGALGLTRPPSSTSTLAGDSPPGKFLGVVIPKPASAALPYASSRTGVVYDARMRFHTEKDTEEEEDIHPEDPRRIYEIYKALQDADLFDNDEENSGKEERPFKLWRIAARFADPSEITLVHSHDHFRFMETLPHMTDEELSTLGKRLDSLYLHRLTFYCAKLSAGGAIEAARAVVQGHVKNAFAIIRPPGHHAEHNEPGGFCFFDNVAVAAKVCQKDYGETCRKIMILDWDVHHGNGVQQAFEDDPNVLYISLHVYQDGTFYPSKKYGDHLHVGIGDGVGRNINIPWPSQGMKDGDYIYAFQKIVMPCAMEFDPDLVIISAGFDAAEGDLLGGCHVSPGAYAHMTSQLMTLAGGKVVACLEGGYNLKSIARSALAVVRTLMGEAPERLQDVEVSRAGVETVRLVERTQSQYWNCLFPKDKVLSRLQMGGKRLSDVIRSWQSSEWFDKFRMAELPIHRARISESFKNQVLATEDFMDERPLMVIFHDPPETIGEQNAINGTFDAHNIIITDIAETYIEAAIEAGFSVIDVNVPKYTTEENDDKGWMDSDRQEQRMVDNHELATYLWDNHLQINDANHIFFVGIGAAHAEMLWIITQQAEASERIDWIFNFVSETSIHPVNRPTDDYPDWYFKHSSVYVANDHLCWTQDKMRRIRKKHGKLIQSDFVDINDMLQEQKSQVMDKCLEITAQWRRRQEQEQARNEAAEKKRVVQEVNNSAQSQNGGFAYQSTNNGLGVQSSSHGGTHHMDVVGRAMPSVMSGPAAGGFSGGLKSPMKGSFGGPPLGLFKPTSPAPAPPRFTGGTPTGSPSKKPSLGSFGQ
ncbi:hypothetical protein EG328_005384 [Venturia inaequalis]|uniref:histone deacetylase n=1 Tax=Venturia inaequalis TaxID=5025 RepID=A0A8H3UM18_VENIN|nr:hypothetical protein EG328_005384 [Venturia inaequalis]RDI87797.1 hypothetical protein Vi05172_g2413 [Venturia inaequalis]